jgi:uncharacterized protein
MKLLFWLVLAIAVVWLMRSNRTKASTRNTQPAGADAAPAPSESMLQCRQCGVYLPASEAVRGSMGEAYCCDAHRASQVRT